MISGFETANISAPDPVTLMDVARAAGVSAATVSRILNGTAKVGEVKRKAVEDAISALNFRPNLFARSLKTGITMTVGVLTQSLESQFYSRALKGIETGLQASGHSPLIVSGHWDPETDAASLRLLISRRVDGLIILTGCVDDRDVRAVAQNQPVVIIERNLQGHNLRSTKLDQKRGGYLATEHLLKLGHTRIAHIQGVQGRPDADERYQGYLDAHRDAGVIPDIDLLVPGDFTAEQGRLAMLDLLGRNKPFTAVFCANDEAAVGARLALYQRGLQVPQDISLVGFDDLPTSAFMTPPLTSVRQPIYEVGLYAAHALLEMMGYPSQAVHVPPLELVVRDTTRRI